MAPKVALVDSACSIDLVPVTWEVSARDTLPVPFTVGKYRVGEVLGRGGMATVHIGRVESEHGFTRLVAIKRLYPHFAQDHEFIEMLLDEARVAGRVSHPNVVSVVDVVMRDGEVLLVMDYVRGVSLAKVEERVPPRVACAIAIDALEGLHAAHETKGDDGARLGIVHRDVSPQNILVGMDGIGRVIDFGIAKATTNVHATRTGDVKGKLAYMAPEQLLARDVAPAADVWGLAVVLWEMLTGKRLFDGATSEAIAKQVLLGTPESPKAHAPEVPSSMSAVVLRGLARDERNRYATARDMAIALHEASAPAPPSEVADWLSSMRDRSRA